MGYTYLICSRSKHDDQIDLNGLPKEGCPYCTVDDLRAEIKRERLALQIACDCINARRTRYDDHLPNVTPDTFREKAR